MTPLLRKFLGLHWILFAAMLGMLAFGIHCIYAAVYFRTGEFGHLTNKWNVQIIYGLLGLIPFFAASLLDYKWVKWGALPMYCLGIGLLFLLEIKGETYQESKSWLTIAGQTFQPSQIAIAATILLMAYILAEGHKIIPLLRNHFLRMVAAGLVFGGTFIFILKEGDLGSAMVMSPIFVAMLLAGSIPYRYLIVIGLVVLIILPLAYFFVLKEYQRERIDVTWKMLFGRTVDIRDNAYMQNNMLIAIGSSGWEGKGYKLAEVPPGQKSMTLLGKTAKDTSHTDYIFTVLAEAWGFAGASLVVIGFLFILIMSMTIAFFSRDALGRLIVVGIMALLFAHSFEHIGMNIGLLPVTGIPLPLVSYGGTFLIVTMFLFGMLQSVWVHRNNVIEADEGRKKSRG